MITKEQDSQHMVIAPTGQRLLWICVFMVAISLAFFYPPVAIVISVFLGLYSLGKIFGTKFVVDKLAQTVGIHERCFLLIHRQRVIPFQDITSVDIDYKKKWGLWGSQALVRRSAWQVSLNVGGEKLKIDHTTNKANMCNLASEVSIFMGKELVDNSEIPGTSFERFFREEYQKPSAPENNKGM